MTTIVNFIEGNFIANPQEKQVEKPFWVLDATSLALNHGQIIQSLVARCRSDKKPLVHIDLGLSSFSRYAQKEIQIVSEQEVHYIKLSTECPYYLVKTEVTERKKAAFLPALLTRINQDIQHGKLRQDKAKCSHANYEFGLLIEGLEAWSLLNKNQAYFQKDIQSFISGLATSTNRIREIVVKTLSPLLSSVVNFHLERSSTCLTKIISSSNNEWKCQSTVRRYNGFSNEEEYTLQVIEAGRVKVVKKKQAKGQERSKDQIQMVNSLGFTVEKDESSRLQQKQLKDLIFPHLKMRQAGPEKCQKVDCRQNCNCNCKGEDIQNLIILDEEQEDDEDLDV